MYQDLSDEIGINKEGRYEVNLSFKISHPILPDNFEKCKKRFASKFNQSKNGPELLSKYDETFKVACVVKIELFFYGLGLLEFDNTN